MEENSTDEILTQPDDRSSTAQSQQSDDNNGSTPSLTTPPTSSSSAVMDSSSCEDAREEEESRSVAASHRDATPPSESLNITAQTDAEARERMVVERRGDAVDTGQEVMETVAHTKQDGGDEKTDNTEEPLKLEEMGDNGKVLQNSPEFESEEEGHGVEPLDVSSVGTLDDMARRIQVEEITPAAGLVSILKRRASLEGPNSSASAAAKPASKRKVRFREPDEGLDHDEVGGDSWLLLLLLCLATVVISVGGTALYCTFGDAQSTVCTDFSHNMDFYMGRMQRGMDELKQWLSSSS